MKVSVRVTANSKKPKVLAENGNSLKVWVDAPALDGKANKRLVEILSDHYDRPKSCFSIVGGLKNRNKIVEVKEK
jgi:uncharacterized protein (TIGR00251 family)